MVAAAMYLQVGAVNRRREQLAVLDDEDVLSQTTGARTCRQQTRRGVCES